MNINVWSGHLCVITMVSILFACTNTEKASEKSSLLSETAGLASPVHQASANTALVLSFYDANHLANVKDVLRNNNFNLKDNPSAQSAYEHLIAQADKELEKSPDPVTNKKLVPPSGDKKDYYTVAPYWWPDPSKPDGLPWIRKDGKVNPQTRSNDTDILRIKALKESLHALIFAYYFSDDKKYAEKAMQHFQVWFIDEKTSVNPNVNFGQGVPGESSGRPAGIIEFIVLTDIITAAEILRADGYLKGSALTTFNKWVADLLHWYQTNPNAIKEYNAHNNHGSWYDVQVITMLSYLAKKPEMIAYMNDLKTRRIATQIQPDGSQPEELQRTKSVNYSTMNLNALVLTAAMAKRAGVDLWGYSTTDGRNLAKAFEFLKPYVFDKKPWAWQQISDGGAEAALQNETLPLFAEASYLLNITLVDDAHLKKSEEAMSNFDKLIFLTTKETAVKRAAKKQNEKLKTEKPAATQLKHPGLMTSLGQLEAIKTHIKKGEQPWLGELEKLKAVAAKAKLLTPNNQKLIFCGSYNKDEHGNKIEECNDAVANGIDAYSLALLGYLTDDKASSEFAIAIITTWADNFRGFDPIPRPGAKGNNAILQAGWTAPWYANAAEILRYTYSGWTQTHTEKTTQLLKLLLPQVSDATEGPVNNWLHSRIEAHIAIAIFLDDPHMLKTALDQWKANTPSYFYIDADKGTPPAPARPFVANTEENIQKAALIAIPAESKWNTLQYQHGQTMETCRDLNHQQLGVRAILNSLAMAKTQGVDVLKGTDIETRLVTYLEVQAKWINDKKAPEGMCPNPIVVNPAERTGMDKAQPVAYEIGYALLRSPKQPLPLTRAAIKAKPSTAAARWLQKWETLTHHALPN